MLLADFRPRAVLATKATRVPRARFPVVDAHNHLAEPFGGGWDKRPLAALLELVHISTGDLFRDNIRAGSLACVPLPAPGGPIITK